MGIGCKRLTQAPWEGKLPHTNEVILAPPREGYYGGNKYHVGNIASSHKLAQMDGVGLVALKKSIRLVVGYNHVIFQSQRSSICEG
jgi:hypothetical protein